MGPGLSRPHSCLPMPASKILKRHWASLNDTDLFDAWRAGRNSLDAFSTCTAKAGSLIQSWIKGKKPVEYEHYPTDDVVDVRHGSQFFYHAHRSKGNEHGHVHLFWHATASGRRRYVARSSPRWVRSAPTHLFAIALDNRGLPVSLFTVNRWVTDGYWFDAKTTMSFVERFLVRNTRPHQVSATWLCQFVRMYAPLIKNLLAQRDIRLGRRKNLEDALDDHKLEQLSLIEIDWAADLDALESEVLRRGRTTS
jgi:hypothetical protein